MQSSAPAPTSYNGQGGSFHPNLWAAAIQHLNVDAPWDQFDKSRTTFTHTPLSRQRILRNRTMNSPSPTYNIGAHWTHYTLDPNETHPIVDPVTNSIPPWRAYHPDHDAELLHFPAAVPNVYVD